MPGKAFGGFSVMFQRLAPATMLLQEAAIVDPWNGCMGGEFERTAERGFGFVECVTVDQDGREDRKRFRIVRRFGRLLYVLNFLF